MLLLDQGADINLQCGESGTALGAAASRGELELVTMLLGRGANPDLTNDLGQKPRDLAEREGHHEVVSLLDSYGASTENEAKLAQAHADGPKDERTDCSE